MNALTVVQIKALLKEKGLSSTGKKDVLLQRLLDSEKPNLQIEKKANDPEIPTTRKKMSKMASNHFDDEMMEFFGDAETYTMLARHFEEVMDECKHTNTSESDGINICRDCGCEVEQLDFQPEWRWYGASDNRISKDPSRCHRTQKSTKGGIESVFQEVKLDHLPQAVKKKAEEKYKKIVGEETIRGVKRKSLVAVCLLYTLRENGDVRTSEEIRKMFNEHTNAKDVIKKRKMSESLKRYHATFKADRTKHVKPVDLIKRTLILTKISLVHYNNISVIASSLEGVDPVLNRSSPQSVASAIVYLYLYFNKPLKKSLEMTKTRFAKEVQLSDITISKLVTRCAAILKLQVTI